MVWMSVITSATVDDMAEEMREVTIIMKDGNFIAVSERLGEAG